MTRILTRFLTGLAFVVALVTWGQAPTGATLVIEGVEGSLWSPLPATITLQELRPGDTRFGGSNGKFERGSPLFSGQVIQAGATIYACDTVLGFPNRNGGPPINRKGASSFVAIKERPGQQRLVWINASVGAYRISGTIISDWEYQVRYYSGDAAKGESPTATIGVVPNSGNYVGVPIGQVAMTLLLPDLPDLSGHIGDRISFPNGFGIGETGTISVLVTNHGPARAKGSLELVLGILTDRLNGSFAPLRIKTFPNFSLEAGGSTLLSDFVQIPPIDLPEGWVFQAHIDSADRILESKEENNFAESVNPGPDLVVSIDDLTHETPLQPGGLINLRLKISNKGFKTAEGSTNLRLLLQEERELGVFVDRGTETNEIPVLKLKPGESASLTKSFLLKPDLPPGTYYLAVTADTANQIKEQDESNNSIRSDLLRVGGVDLDVQVAFAEPLFGKLFMPDQKVEISVRFSNESSGKLERTVKYSIYLSASQELERTRDLLLKRDQVIDLSLESKRFTEVKTSVELAAGRNPPLDRSGTRFIHVVIEEDPQLPETNYQNNHTVSPEFFMGYQVINVVTHGFNWKRNILWESTDWESFRENWFLMATNLATMPKPQSFLLGRVKSYTSQWESGSGFTEAFAALFAAKIAEAAAKTATNMGETERAEALLEKYQVLREKAEGFSKVSRNLYLAAADRISGELRSGNYLLTDPKLSRGFQIVHLIGHSRGAALNARLSQNLVGKGYNIDQYTALDGFATDWPKDAALIADGNIVDDAIGLRKVSYRVETSLDKLVVDKISLDDPDKQAILDGIVGALGSIAGPAKIAGLFNKFFEKFGEAAEKINAIIPDPETRFQMQLLDLRAPVRKSSFENKMFIGIKERSNHVNVTKDFIDSVEIFDNFLGKYHREPRPPAAPARSQSARPLADATETGEPPPPLEENTLLNFRDGTFSGLYGLRQRAQSAQATTSSNEFVDLWIAAVAAPGGQLEPLWAITGDTVYVEEENNALVKLASSGVRSRLAQVVDLGAGGRTFEFDLRLNARGADARVFVKWNADTIAEYPLDGMGETVAMSVPLPDSQGIGELGVEVLGTPTTAAVVAVDNLRLRYGRLVLDRIEITPEGGLNLEIHGGTPGEFMIQASEDLVSWQSLRLITIGDSSTKIDVREVLGATQKFIRLTRTK